MDEREKDSRPLFVAWVSLGCAKNLVDSEVMLGLLAQNGCLVAAPVEDADVIVINTCGFLSEARDESIEVISEAIAHKQQGRARRIVVAGCLCNRDREKLYQIHPQIDALVGVNNRDEILAAVMGDGRDTRISTSPSPAPADTSRFRLTPHHTAYLRISEGCSQRCTYCTIPAIRGPLRSKPPEMILSEARELVSDGAIELNVIAQDTTSYGRDLDGETDLALLLRMLDSLDGPRWIRLLYTYPRRFTGKLIDAIGQCARVVPYVDIPLQHISDDILRRMGRGVKRKDIESLLHQLRDRVEGIVLRTTFIVGFPGESESDFDELLQFVRDFRFDAMGVFEFSREEGTPACDFPNQVPGDVKSQRRAALMTAQQEIAFSTGSAMVGKQLEVLVDGVDDEGRCVGRWYGQAPDIDGVCCLTEPGEVGALVSVTVSDRDGYDLIVAPI